MYSDKNSTPRKIGVLCEIVGSTGGIIINNSGTKSYTSYIVKGQRRVTILNEEKSNKTNCFNSSYLLIEDSVGKLKELKRKKIN